MKITGLIALLAGFLALTMGCDMEYLEKMVNEIYMDEEVLNNVESNSTGNTQPIPAAPSTPSGGSSGSNTGSDSTGTNQGSGSGQNPGGTTGPNPPNQGETTDPNTPNPDGGTPNTPTPDETPTGPDQGGGSTGTNPDGGTANPDQGGGGSGSTSGDSTGTTTGGSSTGTNQGGGSTSNPGTPAGPTITWGPSTPDDPFKDADAKVVDVSDWSTFQVAMNDDTVTTIRLTKDVRTDQLSSDDVVILGNSTRSLTINGNGKTFAVPTGGIMLKGHVQFKNISISFPGPVRNAIFANGYNLTLDSVKQSGTFSIHLFCGGITNYKGSNKDSLLPAPGSHGQIIIKGRDNRLGHIFAGSLDDAPNPQNAQNNKWGNKSTITWMEKATGTVGVIYAHGAREERGGGGNVLHSDPDKYKCTGIVQVNLCYDTKRDTGLVSERAITIDGRTGNSSNALVCYTGSSGNRFSALLKNIEGLKLEPGTAGKAVLAPVVGSSLENAHLAIPGNTELNFTNFNDGDSFEFASLVGGGTLVLKQLQYVEITGQVTETTKLAIGGVNFNGNSYDLPSTTNKYISAPSSSEVSFELLPPARDPDMKLKKDNGGFWKVVSP